MASGQRKGQIVLGRARGLDTREGPQKRRFGIRLRGRQSHHRHILRAIGMDLKRRVPEILRKVLLADEEAGKRRTRARAKASVKATWISLPSGLRPVRSKKNGSKVPIPSRANSAASVFRVLAVEHQHGETFAAFEVIANESAEAEERLAMGCDCRILAHRDQLDERRA